MIKKIYISSTLSVHCRGYTYTCVIAFISNIHSAPLCDVDLQWSVLGFSHGFNNFDSKTALCSAIYPIKSDGICEEPLKHL